MSAQSLGNVEFRVTTEALKQQANEVSTRVTRVQDLFSELRRTIQNTRSYWIGEAGNLYRQRYEERQDELDEMFRRLKEHPRDLLQIAGVYEEGERQVLEIINDLSTNAIS